MRVQTECDKVARAQGHVGIEHDFLGNVAQGRGSACERALAQYADLAAVQSLETKDRAQQRGLAHAVGADQSGELATVNLETHVVEDRASAKGDTDVLDVKNWSEAARRS